MKDKRVSARDILKNIYYMGEEAADLFVRRYGRLQDANLTRALTPPVSELWVERAAWGELATKYVFWIEYMHNKQFWKTQIEMQTAICDIFRVIDLEDQSQKAWHVTGQQVLEGKLEDRVTKQVRFTNELADRMQASMNETEKKLAEICK